MAIEFSQNDIESKAVRIATSQDGVETGHAYLFFITNDLHSEPYALLEDVMINEERRGNGTGTELVKEAIKVAKSKGCYKILATSRFSRENVHSWYQKLGFEKNGFDFRLNL